MRRGGDGRIGDDECMIGDDVYGPMIGAQSDANVISYRFLETRVTHNTKNPNSNQEQIPGINVRYVGRETPALHAAFPPYMQMLLYDYASPFLSLQRECHNQSSD